MDQLLKSLLKKLIFGGTYKMDREGYAISLRGMKFNTLSTLTLFHKLNVAKTKEDFITYLNLYERPLLAFTWATVEGEIGYTPIGHISLKEKKESKICQGWSKADEIKGIIPRSETPVLINPKKGYIVAANNRQLPDTYLHYTQSFAYFNRFHRINSILNKKITKKNKKLDIYDSLELLYDTKDVYAKHVLPKIMKILERNNLTNNEYYNLLKGFDFKFEKDSIAATVYAVFEYKLALQILLKAEGNELGYEDESEARGVLNIMNYWNFINLFVDKIAKQEKLDLAACKKSGINTCEEYIVAIFKQLDSYLKPYKDEQGGVLPWGKVHFQYFPHSFDSNNLFKNIFSRRV
jgi:penicillin amidase